VSRASRADLESLLHADGFGHTLPPRLVLDAPTTDRLPVGCPDLDARLGGGVPVGALTEVTGAPSSGRTGLIVSLVAETTGRDETAAYIDVTDTFDASSAARRGVRLGRLLWVRCRGRADTALKAADAVIRGGGMRVVVLDLGDVPISRLRRIPSAAYLRLKRAVEHTPAALVLLADHALAGNSATVSVQLQSSSPGWSGHHPAFRLLRDLHRAPVRISARGVWGRRVG
jgi:hypothetical protein